jgi:glycosyltransferase involved in cell wall biosynthesis
MSSVDQAISERKAVLLFYQEAEYDKFFKYDRYLKRVVRPLYNKLHHRRKTTGAKVWFELLGRALKQQGWLVRINDYATARKHPDYPVGLVGGPRLLEKWTLSNPAVLGPALYDHPLLAPQLMNDKRFQVYLLTSQWTYEMYNQTYTNKCGYWYAGIDIDQWPDTAGQPKDIDFLIYDKIRWDHDRFETALLEPIQKMLKRRGFRIETLRYLGHDHETYHRMLARSRAMVFLCEHETQGLAYQEALASNVPILAWDNGYWLDPLWKRFSKTMIPATSVPYFSPDCGERFADFGAFEPALNRFLERLPSLRPRKYIAENLTMKRSAEIYADYYFRCGRAAGIGRDAAAA